MRQILLCLGPIFIYLAKEEAKDMEKAASYRLRKEKMRVRFELASLQCRLGSNGDLLSRYQ